ncbi:class I SAM-dependent methyltransferase [Verrucomicrobium sp. BvORR106]|uniref:class I SAM-dependent methyltransferase n=1 Tax=Verrucomicrobium sp. BvORR106 TaxID=1403819 RepID=UPI0006925E2F|nr:class I SAM-dependent methyltransferase [Verrucomicrobium sp. BvORR106]
MLNKEYETMRQVEDTYWWYQVLHGYVPQQVAGLLKDGAGRVLDAGCGTGGTLRHLKDRNAMWDLHGFDFSPLAVEYCKFRGFNQVCQGSVDAIPAEDRSFDVVISLDVLCHAGLDETRAVAEFARVARPGGHVILNLPAFYFLMGRHDIAVGSVRRYDERRVRELMAGAGLRIKEIHYWNAWLFPPILLWRQFSRLLSFGQEREEAKSDLTQLPGWLNKVLAGVARMDMKLCRWVGVPVGTSVFVVAEKPNS